MRRWFKRVAITVFVMIAVPAGYVAASFIGALIPGTYASSAHTSGSQERKQAREIVLVTSLLHADFALPVDDDLKKRFGFLSETGFPLNHPNLRYITVGWGSKAFYTTAGTYSDIEAQAVFKAVTGDEAVMRFVGFGDVSELPDTVKLSLTEAQYERLLSGLIADLKTVSGQPDWMPGESIGEGDAFFEAKGRFNIFHPCNQWANRLLRDAGVPLGIWTPTAQALRLSLTTHAGAIAR